MGVRTLLTSVRRDVNAQAYEIWEEEDGTVKQYINDTEVSGGGQYTKYLGQVATRSEVCNITNLTKNELMSFSTHVARDNITQLKIAVPNWYVAALSAPSNFTEANLGTAMTITASVEYPIGTTPTQITWGGSATGSIAAGVTGLSDFVSKVIPNGATFAIRIWYHNDSGVHYCGGTSNGGGHGGLLDKFAYGTTTADLTMTALTTGMSTVVNGVRFSPIWAI